MLKNLPELKIVEHSYHGEGKVRVRATSGYHDDCTLSVVLSYEEAANLPVGTLIRQKCEEVAE